MGGRFPGAATRLQLARRFIDECFDQPIDLDLMARQAGLAVPLRPGVPRPAPADGAAGESTA